MLARLDLQSQSTGTGVISSFAHGLLLALLKGVLIDDLDSLSSLVEPPFQVDRLLNVLFVDLNANLALLIRQRSNFAVALLERLVGIVQSFV